MALHRVTLSGQTVAIEPLQIDANDSKQYSRESHLEITGTVLIANENDRQRVNELTGPVCKREYKLSDVLAVH